MTDDDWAQRYDAAIMRTFGRPLAELVRGEGCWVWDSSGTKYLDFLAGIAVNALGHAHPALVAAVSAQVRELAHVSNFFATPPQLELAETLRTITGAGEEGRVFFCNSGTEAVEAAFKLARLSSGAGRSTILSLKNSFHGRTMGALSLTGKTPMRTPFEPMPGGVTHIDATIESLEAHCDETVAALVVEPIQGEGGILDLPTGFLRRARQLTRERGILFILDEIQTGIARTGEWFAYQHEGITPDALTLAKGLGGGVPIGALVTFGDASALFEKGHHGSTFGGNPLACAAANAVLTEIERADLRANASARAEQIRDAVTNIGSPLVAGFRGKGLMIGVALTEPVAARLVSAAFTNGLIVNAPNDSTIRLTPPLIVGDHEVNEFRDRFASALAECAQGGAGS